MASLCRDASAGSFAPVQKILGWSAGENGGENEILTRRGTPQKTMPRLFCEETPSTRVAKYLYKAL
ncbi:MAG: hypothetical protein COA75_03310 [Cellvibrionales bacterium]|nr:MAG: hypothetical protein COA75_03310 [Cellvibrionales bacterium]